MQPPEPEFDRSPAACAERLRLALDLYDAGEEMFRLRLKRQHPDWTEQQIEEHICQWLHASPIG